MHCGYGSVDILSFCGVGGTRIGDRDLLLTIVVLKGY